MADRSKWLLACIAAAGLNTACDKTADEAPTPVAETATEATAEAAPSDGSAAASAPEPTHIEPPQVGQPAPQPQGVAEDDVTPPPALAALMRRVGYVEADAAALADFVHLPPGATGQAGEFGQGETTVRVALISYPNPRYARPHYVDVQTRVEVLPTPREAALVNGRYLVHIMARDLDAANALRDQIAETLAWPNPPAE